MGDGCPVCGRQIPAQSHLLVVWETDALGHRSGNVVMAKVGPLTTVVQLLAAARLMAREQSYSAWHVAIERTDFCPEAVEIASRIPAVGAVIDRHLQRAGV